MPRASKREYVTFKSVRLPIYPYKHNGKACYRFAYPDDSVKGGWRYGTRSTKKAAKEAAHCKAVEIANGLLDLSNLPQDQARLARAFLELSPTWEDVELLKRFKNVSSEPLAETVKAFELDLKATVKSFKRSHKDLISSLENFAEYCNEPIHTIRKDTLQTYLTDYKAEASRKSEIRANLIRLFNWARLHEKLVTPNGVHEADKLAVIKVPKASTIEVFTPEELRFLLENVAERYLPWACISAFSSIRPEEIHPRTLKDKPPLDWSMVHIKRGFIEIPFEISKVNKRRLIPINETLKAWLEYINPPKSGKVVPGSPQKRETGRLGKLLKSEKVRNAGWIRNGFRHSYLSYETAIRKDLPSLAIDAGTSVQKLQDNYVEAVEEEQAIDYFNVLPIG